MRTLRVIILFLLSVPAMAQIEPRLFEFGPTAGVNLSNVMSADTFSYSQKSIVGLKGGVFTRINYGKFSLQPEFIYEAKGTSFRSPLSGSHTYRYFSIPVLLAYSPIKHLYVEAGYQNSIALNQLKNYDGSVARKNYGPSKKNDQSVVFGVRINMLDMFSLVSLNFRYVHGLNNVTELSSKNVPLNFKNRSFQVGLSYTFSEQYLWNKKFGPKKN